MHKVFAPLKNPSRFVTLVSTLALLAFARLSAVAQSTEIDYPTLVRSSEVGGSIAARDLGDPRLTRYYYSFTGTPGDLNVTVITQNLDGDVDVFTAGSLRPLTKINVYSGTSSSVGSRTIYFRTRTPLILRVEARTPNDSAGTFQLKFDGAFEPIGSDIPDSEPVIPTVSSTSSSGKKVRRVTSTGARIDEPEPIVAETKPEETPTESTDTPRTEPAPSETTVATGEEPEEPKPTTPRTRRTRPTPRGRRTARGRPTTTTRRTPESEALEPLSGPRLIIETLDGTRVERYMTTVRRVTVENGQIVVVTKDGKVQRQPMSSVVRMSIEP